jgi:hypothetical protein
MRPSIFAFLALLPAMLFSGNLLENSSFEDLCQMSERQSGWQRDIFEHWKVRLYAGVDKCDTAIDEQAFSGERAVKLMGLADNCVATVDFLKTIQVVPGQMFQARVMLRGSGKGYIRIQFLNKQGDLIRTQHFSAEASPEWEPLQGNFSVPEGVNGIEFSLQILKDRPQISFDDASLRLTSNPVLENEHLQVTINSRMGAVIDSIRLKENAFNYTRPNAPGSPGGMMGCIVPDSSPSGIFCNLPGEMQVSIPGREIIVSQQVDSGVFAGLELAKTFTLSADSAEIKVAMRLHNRSSQKMKVTMRVRNIVPAEVGTFSWPTPDWLTTFHYAGGSLNGLNSVENDLLRDGWQARHYEKTKTTILLEYDIKSTRRSYNYLTPSIATIEWYHREVELNPGAEWQTRYFIKILDKQEKFYSDAIGKTQKTEMIIPREMPEPPEYGMPAHLKDFFPYGAGMNNLILPEMAGTSKNSGYHALYAAISLRLLRYYADDYFNLIGGERILQEEYQRQYCLTPGRNLFGETLQKYDLFFEPINLFFGRADIDVADYIASGRFSRQLGMFMTPEVRGLIENYTDRIPFARISDEPLPQSVDVLLYVVQELKKHLPERIVMLPILNSSTVDLMPYLPVFYADFYPIKRSHASGRNPWSVYGEFAARVKSAGKRPVWFMPQAFGGGKDSYSSYGMPSAGDIRLMVNLAVAAGVRGIIYHGCPSSSWPWVINHNVYRYSIAGSAGQRSDTWRGVIDCGRELAGIGPLLTRSTIGTVPPECRIECAKFSDSAGFYKGEAIRLFALKTEEGTLLTAINQNPNAEERGVLHLPKTTAWNFSELKQLHNSRIELNLPPGGAYYIYLGNSDDEIDLVFKSRFRREAVRYKIAAQRAAGNGIPVANPDLFESLPGRDALRLLNEAQENLEQQIAPSGLGKVLQHLEAARADLDRIEFKLCIAVEIMVTPEMRQTTPRYQRLIDHPDPELNDIRSKLLEDFRRFYSMADRIDAGEAAAPLLDAAEKLAAKVREDCASAEKLLADRGKTISVDDPFR